MPHLVEMHKKYAAQGFAVVSVAVEDDPRNEKIHASTLKFLKLINANYTNVILDEKSEVWTKKLGFEGIPYLFVFNREGKYKRFEPGDIEEGYTNIEKLVVEWLKK